MPNLIYDKYRLTSQALRPEVRSVLDVGCRDAILKGHLRSDIAYAGIDLIPGPGVDHVGNVEDGLPFADRTFDAVIALDLLEHTDRIWFVFDELLRVASRQVVVLLPNAYHWLPRLRYLRGREMDKHLLSPDPILDRHRWLVSYHTASRFLRERGARAGWSVKETVLHGGRRTLLLDLALAPLSKNLASWAVMCVLERVASTSANQERL
jgi:SAM-dependent methyltransferase